MESNYYIYYIYNVDYCIGKYFIPINVINSDDQIVSNKIGIVCKGYKKRVFKPPTQ